MIVSSVSAPAPTFPIVAQVFSETRTDGSLTYAVPPRQRAAAQLEEADETLVARPGGRAAMRGVRADLDLHHDATQVAQASKVTTKNMQSSEGEDRHPMVRFARATLGVARTTYGCLRRFS